MKPIALLYLSLFYPLLRICLVPSSFRLAYDRSPMTALRFCAALSWWSLLIVNLLQGESVSVSGLVIYTAGTFLTVLAQRVNPFFLPRVQPAQWLVTHGVYRWCKHPGYVGFALMFLGAAATFGCVLSLLPMGSYMGVLCVQLRKETPLLNTYAKK